MKKGGTGKDEHAILVKESNLKQLIADAGSMIVAYSGGVDSSLLAFYARQILGNQAHVVIAISPSLAEQELEAARAQAEQFSWQLIECVTDELSNPDYVRNDPQRCYFCKSTLFMSLDTMARKLDVNSIAYGANMDDLKDVRPGHQAASEYGVLSPLQSASLTKTEIRELARRAGLPSWNRPQAACLASRLATFETVTLPTLNRIDKAEQYLRACGFRQVRVRHHTIGNSQTGSNDMNVLLARIEIDPQEMHRFATDTGLFQAIAGHMKEIGYTYVTLDLEGYRQGSSNLHPSRATYQPVSTDG